MPPVEPSSPPRAASATHGAAQRQRLRDRLGAVRWWTVVGGILGTALCTGLAIRHTDAANAAAVAPAVAGGPSQQGVPSQSLFQGQGDDGSLLGPAPAAPSFGRSPFRSRGS